ncbi:hypothetical protein [Hoeflea poritis]|uniref:Uncharacterized protein n=1 Tax=Hoeflea poritis TaxID=2993659 RepID=A0ABT4VPY4_9HYPH|nr:hypothetical protein [Hoeflea poritis]MDA4846684.1 hypothetical protein [Hoeflea poritis]
MDKLDSLKSAGSGGFFLALSKDNRKVFVFPFGRHSPFNPGYTSSKARTIQPLLTAWPFVFQGIVGVKKGLAVKSVCALLHYSAIVRPIMR